MVKLLMDWLVYWLVVDRLPVVLRAVRHKGWQGDRH